MTTLVGASGTAAAIIVNLDEPRLKPIAFLALMVNLYKLPGTRVTDVV